MDDMTDFNSAAISAAVNQSAGIKPSATTNMRPVNNPGNIRVPGSSTAFQQFASPEAGSAAIDKQLALYQKRGINTLGGIISTWSPPNENKTDALIVNAAKRAGIDPNVPLDVTGNPSHMQAVKSAILAQEGAGTHQTQASNDPMADFSSSAIDRAVRVSRQSVQDQIKQGSDNTAIGDVASKGLSPIGEFAANQITGGVGAVAGGLSGLASLIKNGGDFDKAAQAVRDTQSALTYQPRSQGAQNAVDTVSNVMDMSNKGLGMIGQAVAGDKGQAIGESVIPVLGALALKGGISKGAFSPKTVAEQFSKMRDGPLPDRYYTPSVAESFGKNTTGAAQGTILQAAITSGASPELQAVIAKAESSGKIDSKVAANHIAADSLPVPIQLTEGQATQNVNTLSAEVNSRAKYQALADRYNKQNGQLIENIDAIRDKAAPDVFDANHIESGRSLINSYNEYDAVLKSDINAKYQALADANGGGIPIDGQTFVANANAELAKQMKGAYLPKETQSIMNEILNGNQQMTFENFENLRTNLANDARKFERQGDGNSAHAISIVRNALEDMPLTDSAQQLKPLADAARGAARERFKLMENDPAYKAAVNGSVAPDDFISKYVINGKQDNIAQMKNNLSADPIASQTIANGVINYLKSKSVGTAGNFSQSGFNGPLAKLQPNLHMLVDAETAAKLSDLGEVARLTQRQPVGHSINNSNTFTAAMGSTAAGTAEGALNVAAHGVPIGTWIRKGANAILDKKAVEKSLRTGAGL